MLHDFRFALRQLFKAPGFTATAVLVLGLGIGANTAVFSLVNTMLFAPPGYPRPNELVQIFSQDTKNPKSFRAFSYPTLNDIREQNSVFSGVAGHNVALVGLGDKDNTRRTFADIATANYFDVLGVAPIIGRGFTLEEEKPGHAASVAIVSYGYWARHNFDRSVLGSEIKINGRPYTVIGIMPRQFAGTLAVVSPELWVPFSAYDFVMNDFGGTGEQEDLASRTGQKLLLIGRFKPGVTAASAEPALKTLAHNLEQAFPVEQKDQTFIVRPLSRFDISDGPADDENQITAIGPLLMGMAAIVLLVACMNLANMLLARGTARRKEIAIRLALGGTPARLAGSLFRYTTATVAIGVLIGGAVLLPVAKRIEPMLFHTNVLAPAALLGVAALALLIALGAAVGPARALLRTGVMDVLREQ